MVDYDDTINKLDDDLLLRIIDLLPTEDALRTSMLSSRWKNLLKCISNIDLSNIIFKSVHQKFSFMDSIDRLLAHHDSSDIKRFHFSSDAFADRWISEVIKHNVEELRIGSGSCSDIYYSSSVHFTLPLCLFKSESLTVFEIEITRIPDTINLVSDPSLFSVHLPSLKRLKLSGVVFFDNHTTQHFFSSLPKLQQLCLYRCNWHKVNRLIIDIPTLEVIDVAIKDPYDLNCQVTVVAPNLTSFKCDTDFTIDFLLSNHSMSSLNVLLKTYFVGYVHRLLPLRFLQSVKKATSLHMGWDLETNLWFRDKRIAVEDLPLFINLRHLEVSAENYDFFCAGVVGLDKMFVFLHKMPNIESFTITVPDRRNKQDWNTSCPRLKDDWSKDGVPSCVINQIKKVTIITSESCLSCLSADRVDYYSTAMDLIKYFMNHSQSLETLEINWLCSYSSIPTRVMLDEIERHPRYSELQSFSCSANYIIPKLQSMPFPWEDDTTIGQVIHI